MLSREDGEASRDGRQLRILRSFVALRRLQDDCGGVLRQCGQTLHITIRRTTSATEIAAVIAAAAARVKGC
jgi:hypothetical protein